LTICTAHSVERHNGAINVGHFPPEPKVQTDSLTG
jgi:hypothetical protein